MVDGQDQPTIWDMVVKDEETAKYAESGRQAVRARDGRRHDGRSAKFRQNVARFRLYWLRFLQENMRWTAFFKIYQILKLKSLKFDGTLQILQHLQFFC